VFASRQADPQVAGIAPDGFVAGDDATAKQTVLDVVESVGFRPVDAGSLASARTLEGMAWLNIQRNLAGGTWQDAWVLVGPETLVADADSRN
jgi:predicted dinucleotide-binding enzyme